MTALEAPGVGLAPTDPLRLLPLSAPTDHAEHVRRYGPLPHGGPELFDLVEAAGVTGRGGAGFPTATKLRAVASGRRRPIVVANGTEGEPASAKDKVLMRTSPHLVLDGIVLAATALRASECWLCIDRNWTSILDEVERARRQRPDASGRGRIRIVDAPDRYVAGEESALVNWINGRDAKPSFVPPRPFERGVRGRPTLVSNVETFAQLALVARYGPDWYRSLGTSTSPGTRLATVTGAVATPGVCEVAGGSTLASLIDAAGGAVDGIQGVLLGGYFGTWLPPDAVPVATLDPAALGPRGASIGCGVVAVLPAHACPWAEVARVARWMAGESADQCGPCVHGLDTVARSLDAVVAGGPDALHHLDGWLELIRGRGACKHPDGVARFVASARHTFAEHAALHRRRGPCPDHPPVLPVPATGGWR
jgi:NADH:ubiquinone oxidoreductase subunit F (NADH-binding)